MSKNINWSAFKLSILIKMVGQIRTLLIIVKIDGKLLCTTKLQNIRRNSVCHKVLVQSFQIPRAEIHLL